MTHEQEAYIPALKYQWLTSLYDPVLRWTMREDTFKRHLVKQAHIEEGHRVLDLGCGTATLTLFIKQTHPEAEVIGLDGDQQVLEIARTKVAGPGLNIKLDHKLAFDTSYADNTFDRVLSSLLFHHLTRENKSKVLKEVFRILRPGGEIHIADWGKAQNGLMRSAFLLVQILDGFETTADNVNGLLPALMDEVGFENVRETAQYATMFGSLSLYRTRKPG
jgi:cyclopropane fatty-acyl-phospholipid synthase-like methyltransferase